MKQQIRIMFLLGIIFCVIGLDQLIKYAIVSGFRWESEMLSIVLVFNDGVAFSMLAFLQGWLKYHEKRIHRGGRPSRQHEYGAEKSHL